MSTSQARDQVRIVTWEIPFGFEWSRFTTVVGPVEVLRAVKTAKGVHHFSLPPIKLPHPSEGLENGSETKWFIYLDLESVFGVSESRGIQLVGNMWKKGVLRDGVWEEKFQDDWVVGLTLSKGFLTQIELSKFNT